MIVAGAALDLNHVRHLHQCQFNQEFFYLEATRRVRTDNTFQFQNTRYEAPRDLRNKTITLRYNRFTTSTIPEPPIAYFDILRVHSQQGGFCLIIGEPGTGKTVLKNHLIHHDLKNWITPVINRSLHTCRNILRLLCQAFDLESDGAYHKCEARLIAEARHLNTKGKILILIIDDAHLIPIEALRKLRLLFEDFPKNHNLIGQPLLNTTLQLRPNQDLKSRITYSAKLEALSAADLTTYIHHQLERVGLPHSTFTESDSRTSRHQPHHKKRRRNPQSRQKPLHWLHDRIGLAREPSVIAPIPSTSPKSTPSSSCPTGVITKATNPPNQSSSHRPTSHHDHKISAKQKRAMLGSTPLRDTRNGARLMTS